MTNHIHNISFDTFTTCSSTDLVSFNIEIRDTSGVVIESYNENSSLSAIAGVTYNQNALGNGSPATPDIIIDATATDQDLDVYFVDFTTTCALESVDKFTRIVQDTGGGNSGPDVTPRVIKPTDAESGGFLCPQGGFNTTGDDISTAAGLPDNSGSVSVLLLPAELNGRVEFEWTQPAAGTSGSVVIGVTTQPCQPNGLRDRVDYGVNVIWSTNGTAFLRDPFESAFGIAQGIAFGSTPPFTIVDGDIVSWRRQGVGTSDMSVDLYVNDNIVYNYGLRISGDFYLTIMEADAGLNLPSVCGVVDGGQEVGVGKDITILETGDWGCITGSPTIVRNYIGLNTGDTAQFLMFGSGFNGEMIIDIPSFALSGEWAIGASIGAGCINSISGINWGLRSIVEQSSSHYYTYDYLITDGTFPVGAFGQTLKKIRYVRDGVNLDLIVEGDGGVFNLGTYTVSASDEIYFNLVGISNLSNVEYSNAVIVESQ